MQSQGHIIHYWNKYFEESYIYFNSCLSRVGTIFVYAGPISCDTREPSLGLTYTLSQDTKDRLFF